jgi:hypothetical protein
LDCDLSYAHERWECGYPRTVEKGKELKRTKALAALGDAVVPQVAEFVGRLIMEAER